MLKKLFSPPVFPDNEEKTRSAFFINIIVLSNIPILALFIIARTATGNPLFGLPNLILLSIITILVIAWLVMRAGFVYLAGYLHITTIWLATTMIALNGPGIHGTSLTSYFVVMLMAGLLLGWRPAIGFTVLSILAGFGLAAAENSGSLVISSSNSAMSIAIEATVLFTFGGIFLFLIINSLQNSVKKAEAITDQLRGTNRELMEFRNVLEDRVSERTKELERQKVQSEKRSRQFEGIVQVSKASIANENLQDILSTVTRVISQQFGYYHVGIFLNDPSNQYAILTSANSEGGQKMLSRSHQLKIGEQGIVGYVTSTGNPRIALDVGEDSVYFNNPDLPLTHSEMALPLKSGDQIIGALDIQSVEHNAFTQDDIEVLAALADQVSLTIQNTKLLDQTRRLLSESEVIQKQYLKDTWSNIQQVEKLAGYKYTVAGAIPLNESELHDEESKYKVDVPITLRGESIGVLAINIPAKEKVSQDQMDLIRAVADRVALSAENARLFDEAQKRAQQLESLNEVGRAISQEIELRPVLRKAYEQLKKIVPLDAYIISLYDEENQIMRFPLVIDEGVEYDYDTQIPFNADSSTGKVILTGKSILQLLDENQYPSAKDAPGMMGNTNRPSASLIYVPLIINQKTNGVMSIQSYSFRAYNQDQLILVENIANQLSISIQNAQLFEEANRRAERERIVAEITSRIGTSVRTESILKTAAQELNHLLNGAEVLIKLGSDRK